MKKTLCVAMILTGVLSTPQTAQSYPAPYFNAVSKKFEILEQAAELDEIQEQAAELEILNQATEKVRLQALAANIELLRTMLEIYALNAGHYPKDLTELLKQAKANDYDKKITNPYSGKEGLNHSLADGFAETGCRVGVVYYKNTGKTSHQISACQKGQQPFVRDEKAAESDAELSSSKMLQQKLAELESPDPVIRFAAVTALADIKDERVVLPLIRRLEDKNYYVRSQTATALRLVYDKRTIAPLVKMLKNSESLNQVPPTDALNPAQLEAISPELLDYLGYIMVDNNLKKNIFETLLMMEAKEAILPFLQSLKNNKSEYRVSTALTLGKLGDARAVKPLIKMLNDEDEHAVYIAVKALGKLKDKRAVLPLIGLLKNKSESIGLVLSSVEALGKIEDKRAVPPLIDLLDNDKYARHAASALRNFRDPRAISSLINALKNSDPFISYSAALALGKFKNRQTVSNRIKRSRGSSKSMSFSLALTQLGDKEAEQDLQRQLVEYLRKGGPEDKFVAMEILTNRPYASAAMPLINLLESELEYPEIRTDAIKTLSKFEGGRYVDVFAKRLTDKNEEVRLASALALGRLGDPRAVKPLIKRVSNFQTVLGREEEMIVTQLGQLQDQRAVEPLINALENAAKDQLIGSSNFMASTVSALGQLRAKRAVPLLILLLNNSNDEVRMTSIKALSSIGGVRAVAALKKQLEYAHISAAEKALIRQVI